MWICFSVIWNTPWASGKQFSWFHESRYQRKLCMLCWWLVKYWDRKDSGFLFHTNELLCYKDLGSPVQGTITKCRTTSTITQSQFTTRTVLGAGSYASAEELMKVLPSSTDQDRNSPRITAENSPVAPRLIWWRFDNNKTKSTPIVARTAELFSRIWFTFTPLVTQELAGW